MIKSFHVQGALLPDPGNRRKRGEGKEERVADEGRAGSEEPKHSEEVLHSIRGSVAQRGGGILKPWRLGFRLLLKLALLLALFLFARSKGMF
jgi:hypothetical protein